MGRDPTKDLLKPLGYAIDQRVIWGQRRPASWPSGIVPTAISRGFLLLEGTGADLGEDASELMGVLEA